jgi:Arc/MetJ-type ribon-helix-helix transcriptional regulator
MPTAKITISLDKKILKSIDQLVEKKVFSNRSPAINEAFQEKTTRLGRGRFAKECAKLNPEAEQALADEGLSSWLKYRPKH